MKKTLIIVAVLMSASFAFNSLFAQTTKEIKMKRVTSIGGIFFKCKDPKKMNEWYNAHLGLNAGQYGASFEWYESPDSTNKATTQWTTFSETTKYFEPSS